MLKTISAAFVAVSVLAAPALAGTTGKTVQAPVDKTAQAPAVKAEQGKTKALNANAKVGRNQKHIGLNKTHAKPNVAAKQVKPAAKRS